MLSHLSKKQGWLHFYTSAGTMLVSFSQFNANGIPSFDKGSWRRLCGNAQEWSSEHHCRRSPPAAHCRSVSSTSPLIAEHKLWIKPLLLFSNSWGRLLKIGMNFFLLKTSVKWLIENCVWPVTTSVEAGLLLTVSHLPNLTWRIPL